MSTHKKNLGFVFTNYNNSNLSLQAIQSILCNGSDFNCFIVIVDNNSDIKEREKLKDSLLVNENNIFFYFSDSNLGYFNGLNLGLKQLSRFDVLFDLFIIGNNDLIFEKSKFFDPLFLKFDDLSCHLVVSPDIVTLDGIHQNPHVIESISRFREIIWDLYFLNFQIARLILFMSNKLNFLFARKDSFDYQLERHIYQGYGACYILTPNFFNLFDNLWNPGFLMGEEFYLAKQLESVGEKFFYSPKIQVKHYDHATVSKISSKVLWTYSKEFFKVYRFFINPYKIKMDNKCSYINFINYNNEKL